MKKIALLITIGVLILSCGSKKKIVTKKSKKGNDTEVITTPQNTDEPEIVKVESPEGKAPNSTEKYIEIYKPIAISEMRKYGIPASITLAQGILESGSGKGRLAVKANNHFGIKCHNWNGAKIYHDDDRAQECFRKYKDASYSFRDHSEFLSKRKRYAKLFELRKSDYKGWARELRRAGYATDKKYPQKLISIIERYELYQYDEHDSVSDIAEVESPSEHVVIKGDTLYSISKRYNVSLDHLKRINGLDSNNISIGQVIYLKRKE